MNFIKVPDIQNKEIEINLRSASNNKTFLVEFIGLDIFKEIRVNNNNSSLYPASRYYFMKTKVINIGLTLVIILMAFFACQKIENNKISPSIQLIGGNVMTIKLGCVYKDPGVILMDDKDPSDAIKITVNPESLPDSAGIYIIKYTAEDTDGNFTFIERTVNIVPHKYTEYVGDYNVTDTVFSGQGIPTDTISNYSSSVVVLNPNLHLIEIENFNNFGNNFKAYLFSDSTGNIEVTFSRNDSIVSGSGSTYCDKDGFSLFYSMEVPGKTTFHRASYIHNPASR